MKKWISVLVAAGVLAASLSGCQSSGSAGTASVTLNEVAHSIFYAPQYAAIELGYFKEEGIDLTLVNGAGADKVMTALISGDADIGFMGSEASIYVYQHSRQFRPAHPAGRKFSGGADAAGGLFLAGFKGKKGAGRPCGRYA